MLCLLLDPSYTSSLRFGERPPPVDNSLLTIDGISLGGIEVDGGALRPDIQEYTDYAVVPASVWALLEKWYGGGPVLPRSVITRGQGHLKENVVELWPFVLKVNRVS